jgi:CBS domain-containing protein
MTTRTVGELMTPGAVLAAVEDTVGEARDRMSQLHISALPVVDADGTLAGIVTADDLLADYSPTLPVSRVMTTHVHSLSPASDAREAARVMRQHHHHHVVVVDGERVVGVLSAVDLLVLLEGEADSDRA